MSKHYTLVNQYFQAIGIARMTREEYLKRNRILRMRRVAARWRKSEEYNLEKKMIKVL